MPTNIHEADVARRYAIAALSTIGFGSMAATSLLQLGIVRDLPDPAFTWFGLPFNSRKVNLSDDARVLGLRDGPIALAGFASTLPLAIAGRSDRAITSPWLPVIAAAKAFGEAVGAAVFFVKMPRRERAWCAYCVVSAFASAAIFALSVPEAFRATGTLLLRAVDRLAGRPSPSTVVSQQR